MSDEQKQYADQIPGYRELDADTKMAIVGIKLMEEGVLQLMDKMAADTEGVDQRWLSIARTDMEKGFMALVRSITRPGRVQLPPALQEHINASQSLN